jgi:hypothetical protein
MAETLGSALLAIRTDDGTFYTDVARAKGASEQLGTAMDKTAASSDRLGDEMAEAGTKARAMSQNFEAGGRTVTASAGAQRAGMQQLSFQLNDVATMYALGARPMQIFASQSGQVMQAVQMMTGGTSRLAGFLGGPWGIAITSAVVVLTPFIGKLFEAEKAIEAVDLASDRMGDAQSILGGVIDLTTGKIVNQTNELWNLARAQAATMRFEAERSQMQAQTTMRDIRKGEIVLRGGMGGGLSVGRQGDGTEAVVQRYVDGTNTAQQALEQLRSYRGTLITDEAYFRAVGAIQQDDMAKRSLGIADNLERALNGDQDALQGFLRPGRGGGGGGRTGPSEAETAARFEDDLQRITQRILSARIAIATSADERAELEARQVEWARRDALDEIAADEHYSELQKADLEAATTRLADAELQAIEFAQRRELEGDALALTEERYRAEQDALQIQLDLANSEGERKAIALALLAAEERFLESRMQAVIDSETANDKEKEYADLRLNALRATSGDRQAAVARANETTLDRYLRDLNQTPEQINEAIDLIKIDGLDSLNNGLVDAIRGVRSLGDVFSSVADQIIADLLRIAIQRAIIAPLADAIFGGGAGGLLSSGGSIPSSGGGFDAILGSFVGGRALGGPIPSGKFAVVGEEGPELAFGGTSGLSILSNSDSRRMLGGSSITIPISIDATGADAAAIARLRAQLSELQDGLPGRIVTIVREAQDRRLIP